jgi:hypothetical protein
MDPILIFMTYRILIVLGGILCIYFGYKLFYVVQLKQGEFKIKTGESYELSLSDVAPGVFFALFGAGILVFCLTNGIIIKPVTTDEKEDPVTGAPNAPIKEPMSDAKDKNTTRRNCIANQSGGC